MMQAPKRNARCASFGRCGNCEFLDTAYSRQLEMKQSKMERLLGEFGTVLPIIGMEDPLHYRCKVHRLVGQDRQRHFVLGNYAQASHRLIPVDTCLLEDEDCQRILSTLKKLFTSFKLRAWDSETCTGHIRHILLRKGFFTGEILLVLVCPAFTFPGKNNLVRVLCETHPEITTIVLNRNNEDTDMILGEKETVLFGPGFIRDRLCGLTFRISAQSFFQVNPSQTEILYQTALDFAGLTGKERILDAYCGTGTIGLVAASRAKQVIGFELSPSAVRDAKRNAAENNIGNASFYCGDAGEQIACMAEEGTKVDVIFTDPPRSGCTETFLQNAAKLGPGKMVYISCGPDSLARDLRLLRSLGYTSEKIQPVDMFPYTAHVETVVLLSRG